MKNKMYFDRIATHQIGKLEKSVVEYSARVREGGLLTFFNFQLAIELGLVDKSVKKITSKLEKEVLKHFGLVIINEYDVTNRIKFNPKSIKKRKYYATRYLQLQHACKRGTTSGDGRAIWYGEVKANNKMWDLVGRGTGGTKLSVGYSIANSPIRTGDENSYFGSGVALTKESVHTVMLSETLNRIGVKAERTLAVITFPNEQSIVVKAYPNMLRPSHFLAPLRQNDLETCRNIFRYYLSRYNSVNLDSTNINLKNIRNFKREVIQSFSRSAAYWEAFYYFVWIDWDGDNILIDSSLIDLSTVVRMGACHTKYRIDDTVRWSTTLLEQKNMTFNVVLSLMQFADFVMTGKKRNLTRYKNKHYRKMFFNKFSFYFKIFSVQRMGYNEVTTLKIIKFLEVNNELENFLRINRKIEQCHDSNGYFRVIKGYSKQTIFSLPKFYRCLVVDPEKFRNGSFFDRLEMLLVDSDYYSFEVLSSKALASLVFDFFDLTERIILEFGVQSANSGDGNLDFILRSNGTADRFVQDLLLSSVLDERRDKFTTDLNDYVNINQSFDSYFSQKNRNSRVYQILNTYEGLL